MMTPNTAIIISVVILIIMGTAVGFYLIEKKSCLDAYENYKPKYGLFSECRIEVNGVLTPVDIVRELK